MEHQRASAITDWRRLVEFLVIDVDGARRTRRVVGHYDLGSRSTRVSGPAYAQEYAMRADGIRSGAVGEGTSEAVAGAEVWAAVAVAPASRGVDDSVAVLTGVAGVGVDAKVDDSMSAGVGVLPPPGSRVGGTGRRGVELAI